MLSPASLYRRITNEKRKFFLNDKKRAHTFIMFLFCGVPATEADLLGTTNIDTTSDHLLYLNTLHVSANTETFVVSDK